MVTPQDTMREASQREGIFVSPPISARETSSESDCAWQLRTALLQRDASACRELAERAGRKRDKDTVRLLGDLLLGELLYPPVHLAGSLSIRLRKRQWQNARLAAVRALALINSPDGLPFLARAILDPAPCVQAAAMQAILPYGPAALPALTSALHSLGNWPFQGMKRLVDTIGRLQTSRTASALVPVILGGRPLAPARWNAPLEWLTGAGLTAIAVGTLLALLLSGSFWLALVAFAMSFTLGGFVWLLLVIVCISPLRASREAYERYVLAMKAAEGVHLMAGKTYLPALVDGAFGHNRISPRPAQKALLILLPLVNEEDAVTMSQGTRQLLMEALTWGVGEEMGLALLGALAYVGTGQCVAKVARWAEVGSSPALREEAARILPILQARQREELAPTTLLRASNGVALPANQLLRAGSSSEAIAPSQLLRAGVADHEQ